MNEITRTQQQLIRDGYQPKQAERMARLMVTPPAPVREALPPSSATVRAWARSTGLECPAKGRVPARIVSAFQAAL